MEHQKFSENERGRILAGDFDIGTVTVVDRTNDLALIRLRPDLDVPDNVFATVPEMFPTLRTKLNPLPGTVTFKWVTFATADRLLQGEFCGRPVYMRGRTSNFSRGKVYSVKFCARFENVPSPSICRIAIQAKGFSDYGDSGAAVGVFDRNGQGTILGILYGGETTHSVSHYVVALEPFLAKQAENGLHLALF
jgi:hypothetical protein